VPAGYDYPAYLRRELKRRGVTATNSNTEGVAVLPETLPYDDEVPVSSCRHGGKPLEAGRIRVDLELACQRLSPRLNRLGEKDRKVQ
jgi:hypothetical protein